MASLRMLLCPLVLIGVLAGLQTQGVSASNDLNQDPPWKQNRHLNDAIKKIDERFTEFDEDSEDDSDVDLRFERSVARGESQEFPDEDGEELEEARRVHEELQRQMMLRDIFNATINGTTVVNLNDEFYFQSHNLFGLENYPNNFERCWFFEMGPDVVCLIVHCEFFRIEWARCCQNDKFTIFKRPYVRGVRRCGRIHGLWLKYYDDIKIAWKTNAIVTKAGFSCKVTGSGIPDCCGYIPVVPAVRQPVTNCSDILPGNWSCQCQDLGPNQICLTCSICQTCEMKFFAVHDFAATDVYLYFNFPCDNCTMDLTNLTFGLNMQVKGHVECFNPNPIVTQPPYPNLEITILVPCPATFDVCSYFMTQLTDPNGRKHSPALLEGGNPHQTQKNSASLVILTDQGNVAGKPTVPIDLSIISRPEDVKNLVIHDTTCDLFNVTQMMDLTPFTQVKLINIYLCDTSLMCNSIKINSKMIMKVTVHLPNIAYCNPGCIVSNQATAPMNSTAISCQPLG